MNMATLVLQVLLGLVFLPLSFLALRQHETDWYGTFLVASGPFASSAMVLASQKLRERILFRPETCLEMGLANATATLRGPLPTPDGTASVRQDHRQYCVRVTLPNHLFCNASLLQAVSRTLPRTHPVGAVVKCFETETTAKDLIPTGNALRASDPTQPPVLQRFATASSQQNPPAHASGRISSTDIEGLDGCGFTTEEIVSLLWLQHWYQTGGSDRVEPLRQWEFLKYLVLNGKLGR